MGRETGRVDVAGSRAGSTLVATEAGETRDRRWPALTVLVVSQFMVVLDTAIVIVALPSIKTALHFSQEDLQWVITGYAICFGGVLLLGGRLADLLGRRRVFTVGISIFTAFSLLDGLAWSEASLIAFRCMQGLGAALISPSALAILTTTFREGRERNRALGVWAAASASGGAVGGLLGGALTSGLGWSWIFFVNVPVGAVVVAAAPRLLRESRLGALSAIISTDQAEFGRASRSQLQVGDERIGLAIEASPGDGERMV